jgi:deoxyadenosine/deoxycytidine kinase
MQDIDAHVHVKDNRRGTWHRQVLIISGVMGSGKSTAAIGIARVLKEKGFKVKITSMTGFHNLAYILTYCLARLTYDNKGFHDLIEKYKVHPLSLLGSYVIERLAKLLSILEILSLHIAFLHKIILPLKLRYDIIVVDEGFINVIGNYMATFSSHKDKMILQMLIKNILRLAQRVSLIASLKIFFLDTDNFTVISRWERRGYPRQIQQPFTYENYLAYLMYIRKARDLLNQALDVEIIDINTSTLSSPKVIDMMLNELSLLFK